MATESELTLRRQPAAAASDRFASALLALLIVISLAADFFMVLALLLVPVRPIVFFPFLQTILGCTLAQGCLLAAWLAWGCQPFWQRLVRHWIVAALLYLAWLAGLGLAEPSRFQQVSAMVGLSVPLMSVAAQLPLWMVRYLFGWRLICGEDSDGTCRASLSIRDLMTATAVVALALALVRWAPNLDGKPMMMPWVIVFGVAATISAMTLLPVSPVLMRTPRFGRGVLFASLYAAFWIGLLWLVVLVVWVRGLFRLPPIAIVIGISFFILSFAVTVILAAAAARAWGFRLVSGRPRHPKGDSELTLG